jgi:hypothetical protein
LANALRGHLAEHGHLVPQGLGNVARFAAIIASAENETATTCLSAWPGGASGRTKM